MAAAISRSAASEALHRREYFFVGGEYVNTTTGTLRQNQMYVEKLTPAANSSQPYPLILFHGGSQDGTNWLNKPDGGVGWASWFLDNGYEVYIVDEPSRGRSAWNAAAGFPTTTFSVEVITSRFTATLNSTAWQQAKLHTQWPGSGVPGDPVFDTYYASVVQGIANNTEQEQAVREAGIALLDHVGPAVVVTHSQGGPYGWSLADARPSLVRALIQIEPKGPPFREEIFSSDYTRPWGLTSIPLTYDPVPTNQSAPLSMHLVPSDSANLTDCILQAEPIRQLPNLAKVPILVETGEASYHAAYDHCTVAFLRQAGVQVEHLELGKAGIHGNGHMQFMELNSDEIVTKLHAWILTSIQG
ncbi:hypothetical protein PFICI_06869 [Pestalotiopsis fici W106-1]|uniref:Uncharacterized protein n=1 Tax=Pestalotiopsis fici (strain W106-1 / CGMCC3.15140) TaxID=1229662 RepID=W3X8Z8_PESFW|nr:uncharacterized protein PFICI_06869 [Pestalotiopsis fici W106-1]ETS81867.1 hypothetical protein PFICI_06869 [Pestalotiopsis fici W106-1]